MRTEIPEFDECSGNLHLYDDFEYIEEDVRNELIAEEVAQEVYEDAERE